MTGQKTKNKPKKYDVFGYELNDRYEFTYILFLKFFMSFLIFTNDC